MVNLDSGSNVEAQTATEKLGCAEPIGKRYSRAAIMVMKQQLAALPPKPVPAAARHKLSRNGAGQKPGDAAVRVTKREFDTRLKHLMSKNRGPVQRQIVTVTREELLQRNKPPSA
jgi:hypothetical protein